MVFILSAIAARRAFAAQSLARQIVLMVRPAFDIAQLTAAERLELIEALWDSLRVRPDALPPSAAEQALVEERRAEHRLQPETAIPWEAVRADLLADQAADEAERRAGAGERGG